MKENKEKGKERKKGEWEDEGGKQKGREGKGKNMRDPCIKVLPR